MKFKSIRLVSVSVATEKWIILLSIKLYILDERRNLSLIKALMEITTHLIGLMYQTHLYSLLPIGRSVTTEISSLTSHFEKELQVFSMVDLMGTQKLGQ